MRRMFLLIIIGTAAVWLFGTLAFAANSEDDVNSGGRNEKVATSEENSHPADEEQDGWYIGPRIGISMFTGVLGIEAQKRHFALTVGLPERVGVKYYFSPRGHSAFMGAFFGHWGFEEDDGDDVEWTEIGIGGGYRWRWRDAWDLTLGASILHAEREEKHLFYTETHERIFFTPTAAVGYSF